MQLRPYQEHEMVEPVRQAFGQFGKSVPGRALRVLLTAPTGAGKTACFSAMTQRARERGNGSWIMVHRDLLVRQASKSLTNWGCPHGVLSAGGEHDGQSVQVVSIQTLSSRLKRGWVPPKPKFLISDECFVAGTKIAGSRVPIEKIKPGETVASFNHQTCQIEERKVVRLFKSKPRSMCRVCFSDGTHSDSTTSHPYFEFNSSKYIDAYALTAESMVLSIMPHELPHMPEGDKRADEVSTIKTKEGRKMLLLGGLPFGVPVETKLGNNGQDQPEVCLKKNDRAESDEATRCQGEGDNEPSLDAVETADSRRKRERPNRSSTSDGVNPWVGHGVGRLHGNEKRLGFPAVLQAGRGKSGFENRHRGERRGASGVENPSGRQEEEGVLGVKRVDRIVIYEPADYAKSRGVHWDGFVYNIEVEGNHNYFANNVLVHNCHHSCSSSWLSVFDAFKDVPTLGVTATPCRLDGKGLGAVFDRLVFGPTPARLMDEGYLVRPQYWGVPVSQLPDISQVGTDMGDFNKAALAKAVEDKPRLTGDVVQHYQRRANGLKFVGFACNIKHANTLRDAFVAAGIPCEVIHGLLSDEERADMVGRLDRGEIRGLWSVDLISEGFDLPEVSCAILCRPTKSLSLHLQQLGRVLRLSEGKQFAVILDHAGNIMRDGLGSAEMEREWSLDGVKKVKRDAETLPAICQCPKCFAVFLRAESCPRCEYVFPVVERKIKAVAGTLKQLSASDIEEAQRRMKALREQGMANDLDALARVGRARGMANPEGWARHVIESREAKKAKEAIAAELLASGRKIG